MVSIDSDQIIFASCQKTSGLLCKNKPKKIRVWINDKEASEADLQSLPQEAQQLISLISREIKQGNIVISTGENTRDNFAQISIKSYSKDGDLLYPRSSKFSSVHKSETVQSLIRDHGLRLSSLQDAYIFLKKEWVQIFKILKPYLPKLTYFQHSGKTASFRIILPKGDEEYAKDYIEGAFKRVIGNNWADCLSYSAGQIGKGALKENIFLYWLKIELKEEETWKIGRKIDHRKALIDLIKAIKDYPSWVPSIAKQLPIGSERGGRFYVRKSGYSPHPPQYYIAEPKRLNKYKLWWDEIQQGDFTHLEDLILEWDKKDVRVSQVITLLKRLKKDGYLKEDDLSQLKSLMLSLLNGVTYDDVDRDKKAEIVRNVPELFAFWEMHFHSHPYPSRPSGTDREIHRFGKALVFARDENYHLYGYYYSLDELYQLRRIFAYAESVYPKQQLGGGYSTERGIFANAGFQSKLPGLDIGLGIHFSGSKRDVAIQGGITGLWNTWLYKFSASKVFENEPQKNNYITGNAQLDVVTPYLDELELAMEYRHTRLEEDDLSLGIKLRVAGWCHIGAGYARSFNGDNELILSAGINFPLYKLQRLGLNTPIPGTVTASISGRNAPSTLLEATGTFSYIYNRFKVYYQFRTLPDEFRHTAGLSITLADRHTIEGSYSAVDREVEKIFPLGPSIISEREHHFRLGYNWEF